MPKTEIEYEQMQLHDGEDDAKTVQLHELLFEPLRRAGHDWDSSDSGVTAMFIVNIGDTIQVSKDGWFRVVRATRMPDMTFTEKDM